MNVFISYTGADREIKNQVVAALRQRIEPGDSVWESDGSPAGDAFADAAGAIRNARVFVLLLSAHAMSPASYVFNEVAEARQRELQGEMSLVVCRLDDEPLTPRFVMQLDHIADLRPMDRTEGGLDSLAEKVCALLAQWRSKEA